MGLVSSIYGNARLRDANRAWNKEIAKKKEKKRRRKLRREEAERQRKAKSQVQTRKSDSSLTTPPYALGMGSAFYLTREWRELRYKALKQHGAKCQCCNAQNIRLHVDHIKPRSREPELELQLSNLQVLCADCNIGKGAWDSTDWRKK